MEASYQYPYPHIGYVCSYTNILDGETPCPNAQVTQAFSAATVEHRKRKTRSHGRERRAGGRGKTGRCLGWAAWVWVGHHGIYIHEKYMEIYVCVYIYM